LVLASARFFTTDSSMALVFSVAGFGVGSEVGSVGSEVGSAGFVVGSEAHSATDRVRSAKPLLAVKDSKRYLG
jgi:hypothetical protein